MDVEIFVQPKQLVMLVIKEREAKIVAVHVTTILEDAANECWI